MAYNKEWFKQRYQNNRAELLDKAKARYWSNREAKSLYDKKRRQEKRAELKEAARKQRERNKGTARALFERARYRSARDGIPFSIVVEDVVVPDFCPALGVRLQAVSTRGGHAFSPSLDRVIPELGYVPGNIIVISRRANSIKRDGSPSEVMKVALWYKRFTSQRTAAS